MLNQMLCFSFCLQEICTDPNAVRNASYLRYDALHSERLSTFVHHMELSVMNIDSSIILE